MVDAILSGMVGTAERAVGEDDDDEDETNEEDDDEEDEDGDGDDDDAGCASTPQQLSYVNCSVQQLAMPPAPCKVVSQHEWHTPPPEYGAW